MFKKPIYIFYFLLIYALAELFWWGYLLVDSQPDRLAMIAGEGSTFLVILLVGAYFFQRTIKREKDIHRQQRNFLLSVTHELKSPLASVKLYLQTILKRDLDKEKRDQFLKSSIDDIGRLDDLVENMLLATRIENKSYAFPKEIFNFSDLVDSIIERIRINTEDKRVIIQNLENEVLIKGDRFSLGSLVNNLIENAVKYSDADSKIEINLSTISDKITLSVIDEGCGISESDRPKIFDKFYRAGSEMTRKTKGTGLGLFIVKQVALHHDAEVNVFSNQPKGTIFEIQFN